MNTFADLVSELIHLLSLTIPLIFGLAFLVIIWKIVSAWIINAADPAKIEEGKKVALIGIIALVIMSGIWGIVAIFQSSLFGI